MSSGVAGEVQFSRALIGLRPELVEEQVRLQANVLARERAAMRAAEARLCTFVLERSNLSSFLEPQWPGTEPDPGQPWPGGNRPAKVVVRAERATPNGHQASWASGGPLQLRGYSRVQVADYFAREARSVEDARRRRTHAQSELSRARAQVVDSRQGRDPAGAPMAATVRIQTVIPAAPVLLPAPSGTAGAAIWDRVSWAAGWVRAHWVGIALVLLLVAAVALIHGIGVNASPGPQDDEGTYMAEAWALQTHHLLAPYQYWYDHPPLGWIQLAGWAALTGGFGAGTEAVDIGRHLVLVDYLVSAVLLYVICRRLKYRYLSAGAAVLLFAASPLAVLYQRYVFLDNLAMPWMLASIVLALSPGRRLWAYAGSGICFAIAVLTKETFLLLLPVLVWQMWQGLAGPRRAFCLTVFGSAVGFTVGLYPLYALLNNELFPGRGHVSLWFGVAFQLFTRTSSGNVLSPTSPAHQLVASWFHLDPWLLGVGIALVPAGFLVKRLRPVTLGLAMGALVIFRGGYLPTPFVIALIPLAALVIAGVADAVWGGHRLRWRWTRFPGATTPSNLTLPAGRARANWGVGADRRRTVVTLGRRVTVLGIFAALVLLAGPTWVTADQAEMRPNTASTNFTAAEKWVEAKIPHRDTLLIPDTMWVDLVDHGFPPAHVVWFFKLGYTQYDPSAVVHRVPTWRGIDFIVSDNNLRNSLFGSSSLPADQTRLALANSTVVTRFGTGHDQIDILRVHA